MGRSCPDCPKNKKRRAAAANHNLKTIAHAKYKAKLKAARKQKRIYDLPQQKIKSRSFRSRARGKKEKEISSESGGHISHHTYYGLDWDHDVPHPIEGDTFVNTMTGEWSIYRHGIWVQIPTAGPRTYLGPSTSPDNNVPFAKEGSLYFDAEGRIYVYQADEWQLVPITMTPSLPAINLQEKETTLTISSPDLSNPALKTQTSSFHLTPSDVKVKIDTTTNSYYQDMIKPEYGIANTLEFQIVPKGKQKITLTGLKGRSFNLSFGSWIQYAESNGQSWQTVIGICDIALYDSKQGNIRDYDIDPEADPDNLISMMDGKYLTTTTASHEIKISALEHKDLHAAEWTYQLLAYPIGNPRQFYLVKDFYDLEKKLEYDLPRVSLHVNDKEK